MLLYESKPTTSPATDAARLHPARECRGPVGHLPVGDDVVAEHRDRLGRRAECVVLEDAEPAQVGLASCDRPYGAA